MTRMKKRKHHIIPKCYLDNFADTDNRIYIYRNNEIFASRPAASLVENHFYTITIEGGGASYIVEDTLANIEGSFIKIYRDKLSRLLELTMEERAVVATFVAAMHLRTRAVRDSITKFIQDSRDVIDHIESLSEDAKARIAETWIPADNDDPVFIPNIADAPNVHNRVLLDSIEFVASMIFDMHWSLVYVPDGSLITSDNPVAVINPILMQKHGLGFRAAPGFAQPDVEVSMPLSNSIAIFCSWKPPPANVLPANQELSNLLNSRTVMYRQRELIATTQEVLLHWVGLMKED